MKKARSISVWGIAISLVLGISLWAEEEAGSLRAASGIIVETRIASAKAIMADRILAMNNPEITSPSFFNASAVAAVLPNAGQRLSGMFENSKIENALYTTSLVTMVALNVADYLSTREALKYKGLQESNLFLKPFVKNAYAFAAIKAGFAAVSYWGMKSLYKKDKRMAWVVSAVSNIALGYVVSNNLRLIDKMKAAKQ